VSSFGTDVKGQKLSLCPAANGKACSVGELPANQQFELVVTDQIGKNATPGEQIGVTINVQGEADTGGALSPAEASVATVLESSSSTSNPPTGGEPPITIPPPTNPDPGIPGTTITPGGLSTLFPTITPSSSPPANGPKSTSKRHSGTKVETVASSSPIDPKLIGGQLAGLAVLAAAITMVVARLSLRTPQAATSSGTTVAAAPPPEPTTPAEDSESSAKDAPDSSES
jgi:hypothetical protein